MTVTREDLACCCTYHLLGSRPGYWLRISPDCPLHAHLRVERRSS